MSPRDAASAMPRAPIMRPRRRLTPRQTKPARRFSTRRCRIAAMFDGAIAMAPRYAQHATPVRRAISNYDEHRDGASEARGAMRHAQRYVAPRARTSYAVMLAASMMFQQPRQRRASTRSERDSVRASAAMRERSRTRNMFARRKRHGRSADGYVASAHEAWRRRNARAARSYPARRHANAFTLR